MMKKRGLLGITLLAVVFLFAMYVAVQAEVSQSSGSQSIRGKALLKKVAKLVENAERAAREAKQAQQKTSTPNQAARDVLEKARDVLEKAKQGQKAAEVQRKHFETKDTGFAGSKNFLVMADTGHKHLARRVLKKAEQYRREEASKLFGGELSAGEQYTIIHVETSTRYDEGWTSFGDKDRDIKHRIWLVTTEEKALGDRLRDGIERVLRSVRTTRVEVTE